MTVEVAMNTPLAEALHREIQPKLVECGWAPNDASDTTMAEYLILMIVNGKTEQEIAAELSSDLLNLPPEDDSARQFARWLFELIESENAKINGPAQQTQPEPTSPSGDHEMDMDLTGLDTTEGVHAPTGPKAMRNGPGFRGGRDKRMLGQINRSLDRSNDSVLHRVRGTDRVNSHGGRGGAMGARGGAGGFGPGRQPRNMNGRPGPGFNPQAVAAAMSGPQGMPWMGPPGQAPMQPGPMDVYAMLEQQSRMMQQMQEQMQQQQQLMQHGRRGGFNNQNRGRPLADRIHHPNQPHRNNFRNGGQGFQGSQHGSENGSTQAANGGASEGGEGATGNGEDLEMGSDAGGVHREAPNQTETVCKFNLHCTNKDCKFAHQSPAAPPGTTVDVHDTCSFGAACKNKKCVGRHPSPAARTAHQGEQDCKFFPNCANPHCPFRHPSMPLCRNGGDCSVPGCKFTHIKTLCKYRPCTNRYCTFKHEDGQRGVFPDKVWTADGSGREQQQEHISERKFVDETATEETILPGSTDKDMAGEEATIA